jgi:hypothetical protein
MDGTVENLLLSGLHRTYRTYRTVDLLIRSFQVSYRAVRPEALPPRNTLASNEPAASLSEAGTKAA